MDPPPAATDGSPSISVKFPTIETIPDGGEPAEGASALPAKLLPLERGQAAKQPPCEASSSQGATHIPQRESERSDAHSISTDLANDLREVMSRLETKLDALSNVSAQLHVLQDLPKQVLALSRVVSKSGTTPSENISPLQEPVRQISSPASPARDPARTRSSPASPPRGSIITKQSSIVTAGSADLSPSHPRSGPRQSYQNFESFHQQADSRLSFQSSDSIVSTKPHEAPWGTFLRRRSSALTSVARMAPFSELATRRVSPVHLDPLHELDVCPVPSNGSELSMPGAMPPPMLPRISTGPGNKIELPDLSPSFGSNLSSSSSAAGDTRRSLKKVAEVREHRHSLFDSILPGNPGHRHSHSTAFDSAGADPNRIGRPSFVGECSFVVLEPSQSKGTLGSLDPVSSFGSQEYDSSEHSLAPPVQKRAHWSRLQTRRLTRTGTAWGNLAPRSVEWYFGGWGWMLSFSPISRRRVAWDIVMILSTILSAFFIPLGLTYFDDRSRWPFETVIHTIDILWPIDILLNLRTGFFLNGELVMESSSIVVQYACSWLVIDLLAVCPLVYIAEDSDFFIVMCLLKLAHLPQLAPRFFRLSQTFYGAKCIAIIFAVVVSVLSIHLLACTWRVAHNADGKRFQDNCIDFSEDTLTMYVSDIYFISVTLTSVGYGDIHPLGSFGRVYSVFLTLLGSLIFGAIVSGCGFFMQKLANNETENRIGELSKFMDRRSVNSSLQRRVRANLRQALSVTKSASMSPQLLGSLSPPMQRELLLCILSGPMLRFPLFSNAQRSFVADLAQAQHWEQILPGDLVADEGQSVREVVFVLEGSLQAFVGARSNGSLDMHIKDLKKALGEIGESGEESPSRTMSLPGGEHNKRESTSRSSRTSVMHDTIINLGTGAWFGEASLFNDDHVYTSVIAAVIKCQLTVLPAEAYFSCLQHFPWLTEKHNAIKAAIRNGDATLNEFAYKEELAKPTTKARSSTWAWWDAYTKVRGRHVHSEQNGVDHPQNERKSQVTFNTLT